MKDLDAGQGIRVYDGWGVNHIYLRKGYNYLKKTTAMIANGSIYNELTSLEGIDTESDDVKAWCQLDFDGYFMVNWNSQENWKNEMPHHKMLIFRQQVKQWEHMNRTPNRKRKSEMTGWIMNR